MVVKILIFLGGGGFPPPPKKKINRGSDPTLWDLRMKGTRPKKISNE